MGLMIRGGWGREGQERGEGRRDNERWDRREEGWEGGGDGMGMWEGKREEREEGQHEEGWEGGGVNGMELGGRGRMDGMRWKWGAVYMALHPPLE